MIGIVVVSHSPALAEAAVELALQMGGERPPRIETAAGAGGGALGTDAAAIAAAIERADDGEGVIVVMDLGSALLSTEMALEFLPRDTRVLLSPAPFVEGLVSAVATASNGASLDEVAAQMRTVADAKRSQLGEAPTPPADGPAERATPEADDGEARYEGVVVNPSGLHARPAATFARAAARFDAQVRVVNLDDGGSAADGSSMISLMALGIRPGTRIAVTATGPQAQDAIRELAALIEDGFGER